MRGSPEHQGGGEAGLSDAGRAAWALLSPGTALHPRLAPAPPDIADLSPWDIAALFPLVCARRGREARLGGGESWRIDQLADEIWDRTRAVGARFDAALQAEAIEALKEAVLRRADPPAAQGEAGERMLGHARHLLGEAVEIALAVCGAAAEPAPPEQLEPPLRVILDRRAAAQAPAAPEALIALASYGGPALLAEHRDRLLEGAPETSFYAAHLRLVAEAAASGVRWAPAGREAQEDPSAAPPLAAYAPYHALAQSVLEQADLWLAALHEGATPYRSDKAFEGCAKLDPNGLDLIETAVRIGLALDAPWARARLGRVWARAAVAPARPGAAPPKTAPSQSLTIRIAKAVQERPTPWALAAMRETAQRALHAGLKKKLDRLKRSAETALASRSDVLALLSGEETLSKPMLTAAKKGAEHLLRSPRDWPLQEWRALFAAKAPLGALAKGLVWRVAQGDAVFSALPADAEDGLVWRLADGSERGPDPSQTASLWRPLDASEAEREAWRDRIAARGLTQPFAQAYRELYRVDPAELERSSTDMFEGLELSAKAVIGAALSTGWRLDKFAGLQKRLGGHRMTFAMTGLYPGADWAAPSARVHLEARRANGFWAPASFQQIDPMILSEGLRDVDLLASVGAFALKDDWDPPIGLKTARLRLDILRRLYGDAAAAGRVLFEGRWILHEPSAVRLHAGSGRAFRRGEPAPPEAPRAKAAAWLPHADPVLARIVAHLHALEGR